MSGAFWCAVVRDTVEVTGRDAAAFLHSQLAQDVASMRDGESRPSLLLDPSGRTVAVLRVVRDGEERFVLDTEPGFGVPTAERLARFKIRIAADLRVGTSAFVAVRRATGVSVPGALPAWWCDGSAVDLRGDEPPAGIPQGTQAMLEHQRIASAWPLFGTDVEAGAIPAETGLVPHAVSFTKGCYPGQELVERMDSRGAGAPHRVVAARCGVPPSPGDVVVVDGAVRGRWTSVSVLDGECVAFARVARGTEIAGAIVPPSRG
ncbi:MAG: hypothetical protein KJS90_01535 [Acidobacteria bacterium]|nr:hypothetical protein [Acidobacteriota bacterium]